MGMGLPLPNSASVSIVLTAFFPFFPGISSNPEAGSLESDDEGPVLREVALALADDGCGLVVFFDFGGAAALVGGVEEESSGTGAEIVL